jgi:hypothetical protein
VLSKGLNETTGEIISLYEIQIKRGTSAATYLTIIFLVLVTVTTAVVLIFCMCKKKAEEVQVSDDAGEDEQ